MRLEKASIKAIKYACVNFHYAKKYPLFSFSFSVFNDKNEWCGVILYGFGVSNNIHKPFGLVQGQVIELQRMALNGKQESTSKALSLSLKVIRKKCPLLKLIVSFADQEQEHYGIIYQATNWYFIQEVKSSPKYFDEGKEIHSRNVNTRGTQLVFGKTLKTYKYSEVDKVKQKNKYKYIYPLDKTLIPMCKDMSKPYPKKQAELHHAGDDDSHQNQGAFDSTVPLKSVEKQLNGQ